MKPKSILIFIMKTLLLSAAMLVVTIIISMIRPLSAEENTAQDEGTIMLLLFTVTTVYALVIGLVIKNARGNRLQLIAGLLLAFYGVQTIIGQIEVIFFAETMSSTFIFGVLLFWLFSLAGRNKIQEITKEIYHEPEITSKERRFRHE